MDPTNVDQCLVDLAAASQDILFSNDHFRSWKILGSAYHWQLTDIMCVSDFSYVGPCVYVNKWTAQISTPGIAIVSVL